MKQSPIHDEPSALAALRRARRVAEDIARRTRTALVVMVDGEIVRVFPAAAPMDATNTPSDSERIARDSR